jgi:thiol-disulfide isomerase/thioredoxin
MPARSPIIKKIAVGGSLPLLLGLIGIAFYYQDWQYSLPTKRPASYHAVALGSQVQAIKAETMPVVYHFSGTDCPCSEFVIPHLRALAKKHQGKIRFVFVEEGFADEAEGLPHALKGLAYYQFDSTKSLARRLGVYGTPVAAVVDGQGKLYFTGNYNRSRYCQDPSTEYVRMALDSLAAGKKHVQIKAPPVKGCAIFNGIETLALQPD